ncbi:DUF6355 family natural product biosynthesis protein [Nonomuraea insulae]|uniref:DUF6355 family natural product biosynthesis protein n=1 Tax=Nonomuraea insulae TaxID=1616787 RepID=A0ABW1CY01_9ACTN
MFRKARTALIGLAVAAGMVTVGSAPVQAATSAAMDAPCGWFVSSGLAKYNHCDYNNVIIYVDRLIHSDYEKCVGPGVTTLGIHPAVKGAWYNGRLC